MHASPATRPFIGQLMIFSVLSFPFYLVDVFAFRLLSFRSTPWISFETCRLLGVCTITYPLSFTPCSPRFVSLFFARVPSFYRIPERTIITPPDLTCFVFTTPFLFAFLHSCSLVAFFFPFCHGSLSIAPFCAMCPGAWRLSIFLSSHIVSQDL